MRINEDDDFVGINELKRLHLQQYEKFVKWAEAGDWISFHHSHYDWWMFPIDKGSGHGLKYTVYEYEISTLKKDAEYILNYLHGVELLAQSWGWDLKTRTRILNPAAGQQWANWPIRLKKAVMSLLLFSFREEALSLLLYAQELCYADVDMNYRGQDLASYFLGTLKLLRITAGT